MKRAIFGLIAFAFATLAPATAFTQSSPNLRFGQVPTAAQWNSYFAAKQDYLGYVPLNPSNLAATAPIVSTSGGGTITISCPTCLTGSSGLPASSIIYAPPGTGSVSVTQQTYDQRVLWAADYGAVCDGVTDDATAFQNLINEAILLGVPARFTGTCKIASQLSITNLVDFGGYGRGISVLSVAAGITAISVFSLNPVSLSNFDINFISANGSNIGVKVVGSTGSNTNVGSRFNNLFISSAANGLEFDAAEEWVVLNTTVNQFSNVGIAVQNTVSFDAGDSTVYGSLLIGAPGAAAGVFYQSSGGFRFENNKVNGTDLDSGLNLRLADGAVTGVMNIVGNSFEGLGNYGIAMSRAGTTGSFAKVNIVGNEFAVAPLKCVYSPTDATGVWLEEVVIQGNTCGTRNSASAIAVDIDSAMGLLIEGNAVVSGNAATKILAIGSSVTFCTLGLNNPRGTFAADTGTTQCSINLSGLRSGASGSIPYYSAIGQLSSSALLTQFGPIYGGGAGSPPVAMAAATDGQIIVGQTGAAPLQKTMSGDATLSAAGALTLGAVNSNVGTFGSATQSVQFTVNGKGLITAAANVTVTPAVGSITGLGTGVATALAANVGSPGAFVTFNGALGTPSSATLTNATGLPTTGLTGTLQAAQEPAHTGDVTNSAGSLSLTIANNAVTLAKLATQATNTVLGNATSGTAVPTALSMTSCSTAASAVTWTTNTGFGCNTSITAASATNATNTAITDDTTTNVTVYPTWVTSTTGNLPQKVSSSKMNFNPSTGIFFSNILVANSLSTNTINCGANAPSCLTISGTGTSSIGLRIANIDTGSGDWLVAVIGSAGVGTNGEFVWYDQDASAVRFALAKTSGNARFTSVTSSTSKTTGSLINAGGFGNAGAIFTDTLNVVTMANSTQANSVCYNTGTGLLTYNVGELCTTSSARFKQDLRLVASGDALGDVVRLHTWAFRYRAETNLGSDERFGLLAEEAAAIDLRLVDFEQDGFTARSIRPSAMIAKLVGAVSQLKADNDNLHIELEAIKRRLP